MIDENRHLLKPSVSNVKVLRNLDYIVMVVADQMLVKTIIIMNETEELINLKVL
jgi:hypothetical protein